MTWSSFNGTEFAFHLKWLNASALPLYTQVTSPVTDAANTNVCDLRLSSVTSGQAIFLPFAITPRSPALQDVNLNIAVHPIGGGSDFAIVYNIAKVNATNAPITPSNITCQQR